jgi:hypothetical protein
MNTANTITGVPEPSVIGMLLGVFLLGGFVLSIALLVALLASPKTRKLGLILLGAGGLLLGMTSLLAVFWWMAPVLPQPPATVQHTTRSTPMLHEASSNVLSPVAEQPTDATPKPAWIDSPPKVVGDSYRMTIVVGPFTTRQECDAKLPEELQKALFSYAEMYLGQSAGRNVEIVLPADYLRQHLVKDQWEEVRQYSVGPMTRLHVLLAFDQDVKNRVVEAHRQGIVAWRIRVMGVVLGVVLGLLAVAYGYLKTDLATAGAYRGRLQLAAGLAILGIIAAAMFVA